jgi:hypothetical protein
MCRATTFSNAIIIRAHIIRAHIQAMAMACIPATTTIGIPATISARTTSSTMIRTTAGTPGSILDLIVVSITIGMAACMTINPTIDNQGAVPSASKDV